MTSGMMKPADLIRDMYVCVHAIIHTTVWEYVWEFYCD